MYLNIYYDQNPEKYNSGTIHLWDDETGYSAIPYTRYGYKKSINGTLKTITGELVKKVTRWSRADEENGLLFESDVRPETRFLIDHYNNSETPSSKHIEFFMDIEVSTTTGLPDVYKATNEITAIAFYVRQQKEYTVLLLDPNKTMNASESKDDDDNKISVQTFETEKELLETFIDSYLSINPTILITWNGDNFDIPYIYNRIKNVCGEKEASLLSPIFIVKYDKNLERYKIAGVSHLDYMKLYKTFTFGERVSYSLDNISKMEIGEGKIKYSGSLDKLYKEDKELFIKYNLNDVILMVKIDNKMKLIDLAKGIAHKGRVQLEDVFFSSKYLDGAILTYIKNKGLIGPNKPIKKSQSQVSENDDDELEADENTEVEGFSGAYVKAPIPGKYNWLIDLDFTSLYPSVIRSLNISPETKMCKINNWNEIIDKFSVKL